MSVEGAPWLDRREREREEDPDLALRLLKIPKGAVVGDVGAGSGYMSLRLARIVGAERARLRGGRAAGHAAAPAAERRQGEAGQRRARARRDRRSPKLPAGALDLIIMVDVYHEFSEPQKMLQRMREALKPGGRLALFEYRAEDPDVPILPLHKMTKAQVKTEVELEGFKQQRVFDDLPWQHLIVFTRP